MKKELSIRTGKPGRPRHPRNVNTAAAAIIGPAVIRSLADAGFTIVPTAMLDTLTACKLATADEHRMAAARADVEERCAPDPALTTKPAQPPVGKEEGA